MRAKLWFNTILPMFKIRYESNEMTWINDNYWSLQDYQDYLFASEHIIRNEVNIMLFSSQYLSTKQI